MQHDHCPCVARLSRALEDCIRSMDAMYAAVAPPPDALAPPYPRLKAPVVQLRRSADRAARVLDHLRTKYGRGETTMNA